MSWCIPRPLCCPVAESRTSQTRYFMPLRKWFLKVVLAPSKWLMSWNAVSPRDSSLHRLKSASRSMKNWMSGRWTMPEHASPLCSVYVCVCVWRGHRTWKGFLGSMANWKLVASGALLFIENQIKQARLEYWEESGSAQPAFRLKPLCRWRSQVRWKCWKLIIYWQQTTSSIVFVFCWTQGLLMACATAKQSSTTSS